MKQPINEFKLKDSGYKNVTFGDKIVGNSTPSTDKTNPDLLKDVSAAAQKSGINVTITTAKTGHSPKGRHKDDDAIDIAIVNGKGFSGGKNDAINKGIYDDIMSFVGALESMGYKKNVESGNEKSVLTFGFPGHDNHIHISRSRKKGMKTDFETQSVDNYEPIAQTQPKNIESMLGLSDFLGPVIQEEVSRIKEILKKII